MGGLTLPERTRWVLARAERTQRTAAGRAQHALLRLRQAAPRADRLLILPPDLRTADASFVTEIAAGQLGLAGTVVELHGGSPFKMRAPSPAWARELNGFAWLRHLRAAQTPEAADMARALVADWLALPKASDPVAWEAQVLARRLISWVTHAGLLLEGADESAYAAAADSLSDQLLRLSTCWRCAPPGSPRLIATIALALAGLCLSGFERELPGAEAALAQELEAQIFPDGGHISRNPAVLVEVLLDLLPLQQCFRARERKPPAALPAAMRRMVAMLRYLRLGDGSIPRFNGAGDTEHDAMATVLAYDDGGEVPTRAPQSRYVRLERGSTVLVMDVGAPPAALELAGGAAAGCLSFELSSGTQALFVNGGHPCPADEHWGPASRATASHNTLCIGETSSSELVRHKGLEGYIGAIPIRAPQRVLAHVREGAAGLGVQASHDGYLRRYHLLHRRSLTLDSTGRIVDGIDQLGPAKGILRFARDLPFAVHFHLHPDVTGRQDAASGAAEIATPAGERWRLAASGARLSIEESTHYACASGARRSVQVVLRAATYGEAEVRWRLERIS